MSAVEPWEFLRKEELFRRYGRGIDLAWYKMPDGRERDFALFATYPGVAVLALTGNDQVILAKQFRPGPGKILHELPGGMIDGDEDPTEAATRELLEETGYQPGLVVYAGSSWVTAYSEWRASVCVALGCKKVAEPRFSKDEYAETVLMPLPEFRELVRSGEITDVANAYMALDRLGKL